MKTLTNKTYVIVSVLLCALAMSVVDGILQPAYAVKSAIKVVLFLIVPMCYFWIYGEEKHRMRGLFLPKKKTLFVALLLGIGVYGFILAGYGVIANFVDISDMVVQLTGENGVSADNFLFVSLYISLINSLLEEFLFRGFAFLTLKKLSSRRFAYVFSAAVFAAYHFGMIAGSMDVLVWILSMAGLFIAGCVLNFLNERGESLITSWLVHMFANFAINTIGFRIFGMI